MNLRNQKPVKPVRTATPSPTHRSTSLSLFYRRDYRGGGPGRGDSRGENACALAGHFTFRLDRANIGDLTGSCGGLLYWRTDGGCISSFGSPVPVPRCRGAYLMYRGTDLRTRCFSLPAILFTDRDFADLFCTLFSPAYFFGYHRAVRDSSAHAIDGNGRGADWKTLGSFNRWERIRSDPDQLSAYSLLFKLDNHVCDCRRAFCFGGELFHRIQEADHRCNDAPGFRLRDWRSGCV